MCMGSAGGWITRRQRNYSKNICISVEYGETWTQVETGGRGPELGRTGQVG